MMLELFFDSVFGLVLTVVSAVIFLWLKRIRGFFWVNPLLLSIIMIISLLQIYQIPYATYKKGADIIHLFLGPITVILAAPLYEHRNELLRHKVPIFTGTVLGSLSALLSVLIIGTFCELPALFIHSLLPKSCTTPIGISASQMLDAIVGLSVISIIITGIFGSLVAPILFKIFKIKSPIAKGIALGTTSHAVGTAKAYELNPLAGAMSGLSIGLSGVISIFWIIVYTLAFQ